MKKLAITQVRSEIKRKYDQRRNLRALGITRLGRPVIHDDTPQVRGMINKVSHLVEVEEVEK